MMFKFKIGDKVVERKTGDVGVITRISLECSDSINGVAWFVLWEPDFESMWCYEHELDFYADHTPAPTKVTQNEITKVSDVIEYNGHLYKLIGKSSGIL